MYDRDETKQMRQFSKGKELEQRVLNDLEIQGIYIQKIPEGARRIGKKIIQHKTVYDFIAIGDDVLCAFDTKECQKNKFFINSYVLEPKKIHQFKALLKAQAHGIKAGYLIHFTELKQISWLPVSFIENMVTNNQPSIGPESLPSQPDDKPIDLRRLLWA